MFTTGLYGSVLHLCTLLEISKVVCLLPHRSMKKLSAMLEAARFALTKTKEKEELLQLVYLR